MASIREWRDIASRVRAELEEERIDLVAASVAFWAMLALFPALIALVSIYGLVADPTDVEGQVAALARMLPSQIATIIEGQMRAIVSSSSGALSFGLVVSTLGALWATSGGTSALITAIRIVYDEPERAGFVRRKAVSLAFTLGAIAMIAFVVLVIGVLPIAFAWVGLGEEVRTALVILRWPIVAFVVMSAISMLYRHAPSRARHRRWITAGSVIATLLWLGSTLLFSAYVSSFGRYNELYGALGGVIVLLLWLYITAYVILLGAEVDAELEHRRATREPRPSAREIMQPA